MRHRPGISKRIRVGAEGRPAHNPDRDVEAWRASCIAVAAPAHRAPTTTTSCDSRGSCRWMAPPPGIASSSRLESGWRSGAFERTLMSAKHLTTEIGSAVPIESGELLPRRTFTGKPSGCSSNRRSDSQPVGRDASIFRCDGTIGVVPISEQRRFGSHLDRLVGAEHHRTHRSYALRRAAC
jgi:hypothetical protein